AIIKQADIKHVLDLGSPLNFNEVTLRRISEKLEAHFLVLGSLTRIGDHLSLDVYVFNPSGSPAFSKDFTESKELNSLIEKMARKINANVLLMASTHPELKEPELLEEPAIEKTEEVKLAMDVQPAASTTIQAAEEGEAVGQELAEEQAVEETLEKTEEVKLAMDVQPAASTTIQAAAEEGEAVGQELPEEQEAKETPAEQIPKADVSASSPFDSDRPVKITSKNLEADNKRNEVTFRENVVAKQGDMVIFSDVMKVKYETKGGIRRIEAIGNVKMKQEDRIATGEKIVFYNAEQKIVMTGNPRIWQDDNLISCDKVTVFLKDDKILFEGKVDSTIYPKRVKESKKRKDKQVEEITPPPGPTVREKKTEEKEEPASKGKISLESAQRMEKEAIQQFLSAWKHNWESKNLENYMACYAKAFSSMGMDWDRWKTYKKRLNGRYRKISLVFNDLRIVVEDDQATVSFEQHYQSDEYSDHGMKSLKLKKEDGVWKILSEEWTPL
ncbi:MAG: lipopolysaccharide transport periplasmic protein LptA, partial [Kosmotogaceae bacterium]|nr:lipopolysaccharide transport periplasmic protein LptA [Kosmotogaceae bacterium]